MDTKESEFIKRLEAVFKTEAEEHIRMISEQLIEFEKKSGTGESTLLSESIFREIHSLKGASRSVNRNDIESVCRVLENIFAKIKDDKFTLAPEHFDIIHGSIEHISDLMEGKNISAKDSKDLLELLRSVIEANVPDRELLKDLKHSAEGPVENPVDKPTQFPEIEEKSALPKPEILAQGTISEIKNKKPIEKHPDKKLLQKDTVRIETAKLDPLFLQAEQLIQSKIASNERVIEMNRLLDQIRLWKSKIPEQLNTETTIIEAQFQELRASYKEQFTGIENTVDRLQNMMENDQRILARMIDEHLESMKVILMLPISNLVEGFPKLVRDLARSQGKDVELIMNGQEIEVDKRILQELKDPLIHLIRNCVDHGIPDHKNQNDNNRFNGQIKLNFVVNDGRNLEIKISDNGKGIDQIKVLDSAIKGGLITNQNAQALNEAEILSLVFKSGISTSPIITDISGRGLGLAIVPVAQLTIAC